MRYRKTAIEANSNTSSWHITSALKRGQLALFTSICCNFSSSAGSSTWTRFSTSSLSRTFRFWPFISSAWRALTWEYWERAMKTRTKIESMFIKLFKIILKMFALKLALTCATSINNYRMITTKNLNKVHSSNPKSFLTKFPLSHRTTEKEKKLSSCSPEKKFKFSWMFAETLRLCWW